MAHLVPFTPQENIAERQHLERIRAFEAFAAKFPYTIGPMGDLKNKYRNRKCPCSSGLKIKNCHGIRYRKELVAPKQRQFNLGSQVGGNLTNIARGLRK